MKKLHKRHKGLALIIFAFAILPPKFALHEASMNEHVHMFIIINFVLIAINAFFVIFTQSIKHRQIFRAVDPHMPSQRKIHTLQRIVQLSGRISLLSSLCFVLSFFMQEHWLLFPFWSQYSGTLKGTFFGYGFGLFAVSLYLYYLLINQFRIFLGDIRQ